MSAELPAEPAPVAQAGPSGHMPSLRVSRWLTHAILAAVPGILLIPVAEILGVFDWHPFYIATH